MYGDTWDRQSLLFKIKVLKDRVEAFESGKKYTQMKELHKIAREGDSRTIKRLRKDLETERAEKIHVREERSIFPPDLSAIWQNSFPAAQKRSVIKSLWSSQQSPYFIRILPLAGHRANRPQSS